MDQAKLSKVIAKQRKLVESSGDNHNYSSIIASILEEEAKGTYNKWPSYMRDMINNFYREAIEKYKLSKAIQMSIAQHPEINNLSVITAAVVHQAIICGELSREDIPDFENNIKKLVNMKLLHERFLADAVEVDAIVA